MNGSGSVSLVMVLFLASRAGLDADWRVYARTWVDADKELCGIGQMPEDALAVYARREDSAKKLRAAQPSVRDIEAALSGSSSSDRLLGAAAVAVIGDASDAQVDGLIRRMQARDLYTRLLAVRALRSAVAEQLVNRAPALTTALLHEQSPSVLLESFALLEQLDVSDATPVFGRMFELPDERLHAFGYAILQRLGPVSLESVQRYVAQRGTVRAQRAMEAARAQPAK